MDEIVSANNWLIHAGAHLIDNKLIMPHQFLLVPMTLASEAIVEFKKHDDLGSKIKHGIIVVSMVRMADTAFYNVVADIINGHEKTKPNICANCLRGQLCGTNMKKFRQLANRNIIHKMESGKCEVVTFEDLEVVELYYEEIFKLPLIDPISFPEREGIELCGRCIKKWSNYRSSYRSKSKKDN